MKIKTLALIIITASVVTGCRLIAASQITATPEIIELETEIPTATAPQPARTSTPIINEVEPVVIVPQPEIETVCNSSDANLSSYEVSAGDTLTTIATRYNMTVDILMQVNCLNNADNLQIGQILYIPTSNNPFADPVELPVIGGSGEPPQNGCFVERNIGINDVFVHHDGSSIPVAKLGSYLPLESVVRNAYIVIVEGFPNNLGWVWQDDAQLVGNGCQINNNPPSQPVEPPAIIPAFGYQGDPPVNACSAIQNSAVETAFVYSTPEAFNTRIGRLDSAAWLPVMGSTANGYTVTLADGRTAWMPSNDIVITGPNCPTN